jgi:hypothetical protein
MRQPDEQPRRFPREADHPPQRQLRRRHRTGVNGRGVNGRGVNGRGVNGALRAVKGRRRRARPGARRAPRRRRREPLSDIIPRGAAAGGRLAGPPSGIATARVGGRILLAPGAGAGQVFLLCGGRRRVLHVLLLGGWRVLLLGVLLLGGGRRRRLPNPVVRVSE